MLFKCKCLNAGVHLCALPTDANTSLEEWSWVADETSIIDAGFGDVGVAGEQVIWEDLVKRRVTSTGWEVVRCYNCGMDVFACKPDDRARVVINKSLVSEADADATVKTTPAFSPVFHISLVNADEEGVDESEEQLPDPHMVDTFKQLRDVMVKGVDKEREAMEERCREFISAQHAAFDAYEKKANRDRKILWKRIAGVFPVAGDVTRYKTGSASGGAFRPKVRSRTGESVSGSTPPTSIVSASAPVGGKKNIHAKAAQASTSVSPSRVRTPDSMEDFRGKSPNDGGSGSASLSASVKSRPGESSPTPSSSRPESGLSSDIRRASHVGGGNEVFSLEFDDAFTDDDDGEDASELSEESEEANTTNRSAYIRDLAAAEERDAAARTTTVASSLPIKIPNANWGEVVGSDDMPDPDDPKFMAPHILATTYHANLDGMSVPTSAAYFHGRTNVGQ